MLLPHFDGAQVCSVPAALNTSIYSRSIIPSVVWPSSSFSWYQPVQHCRNSTLNQVFRGSPERAPDSGSDGRGPLLPVHRGMGFLQWSLWRRRRWFNGEYQQKKIQKKALKKGKMGVGNSCHKLYYYCQSDVVYYQIITDVITTFFNSHIIEVYTYIWIYICVFV